mmetsp:Transcript_19229/g.33900  ORF Transcript_19229/g.33900 Transcript_19229/m.33900 type:complete len:257 (+) Transcript_19229:51-821(+)
MAVISSLLLLASAWVALARLGEPSANNTGTNEGSPPGDTNVTLTPGFTVTQQHKELLGSTSTPLEQDELLALNSTLDFVATEGGYGGYDNMATTTVYGDSQYGACGSIKTADLVAGTNYHNVASAQSMWRNCKSHGNCMCGASGGGGGTKGMGCFTCGKGRFLHSAYGTLHGAAGSSFASDEVIFVVGDLCPHAGNEDWCPEMAGQKNDYGVFNHLDFSHPPPGIRNNNFVFSQIECPADLRHRFQHMAPGCGAAR